MNGEDQLKRGGREKNYQLKEELPVNVGSNVIKTVNICKNRTANGIVQSNGGGGVECK